MRQRVLKSVPKFGNDDDYVDTLAAMVMKDIAARVDKVSREMEHAPFTLGMGVATFETYMTIGYNLGASPDGRLAQEPVSSNFSPTIGMDLKGPTAAIKSVTLPDLAPYFIGCPLDMQINANEAVGEEGIRRIIGLVKSFFELGGLILTMTGVNEEDLRKAQVEPAKYQSLRVRMGGLSAYFIALSKEHQEVRINRVKYNI